MQLDHVSPNVSWYPQRSHGFTKLTKQKFAEQGVKFLFWKFLLRTSLKNLTGLGIIRINCYLRVS
jgi:hypothetical protein